MYRIRWWALILLAAIAAAIGAGITLWTITAGHYPWHVSPWVAQLLVWLGVYLLLCGWAVRQMQRGKRTAVPMNQHIALRILLLAQASAILGALVVGYFGGQLIVMVSVLEIGARARTLWPSLIAVGCALVLVIASLITQHWCSIRGDGEDPNATSGRKLPKLSSPPNVDPA